MADGEADWIVVDEDGDSEVVEAVGGSAASRGLPRAASASADENGDDDDGFMVVDQISMEKLGFTVAMDDETFRTTWKSNTEGMQAWAKYLDTLRWHVEELGTGPEVQHLVVTFGMPERLRGEMWQALCFRESGRKNIELRYSEAQATRPGERDVIQIDKDLHRTFPENTVYQSPAGIASLRRVLVAFVGANPRVGYTQALNYIAAMLLLLMPEAPAFCMLEDITRVYVPGYFSPSMSVFHSDCELFDELLRSKVSRVAEQFALLDVFNVTFLPQWMLCLFVTVLPLPMVLRVWDMFFLLGVESLFRVALAVLREHQELILEATYQEEILEILQKLPRLHIQTLFETAMSFHMDAEMTARAEANVLHRAANEDS
eukprot:c6368_g1_i1.p2 GENE.c6368_g1_i1~~c6368_g1_i1.p2  ORF type:complete len:374 (+),score=59.16 c6368_g1_i1:60-1181(+)